MGDTIEEKAVGRLSELLALDYGICPEKARHIRTAAALHDVGKLRLPAALLNKPGKLDAHEFEVIKTHTVLGAKMLQGLQGELGVMARTCCLYHHEWWNGCGYCGRRIDELPLYVSITAISDVYIALISKRPYKHAWPQHEAMAYIQSKAGTQFNPALVKGFLSLIRSDSRVPAIFTEGR
jgi:putative two-component system response regulator